MRRSFILPQLFIGLSAGVALMLTTPLVQAQLAHLSLHTFTVRVQGEEEPFELRADHLSRHANGMLTLEADGRIVAAFNQYQVLYVLREAQGAEREFEVKTHDGKVRRFRADHLRILDNGPVEVETGGEVTGLITNNNVRYVVAVDARHPEG